MNSEPLLSRAIGDRVRKVRQSRGWTLKELSTRTHVSEATLCRIENGTHTQRPETLRRLEEGLGMPVVALAQKEVAQASEAGPEPLPLPHEVQAAVAEYLERYEARDEADLWVTIPCLSSPHTDTRVAMVGVALRAHANYLPVEHVARVIAGQATLDPAPAVRQAAYELLDSTAGPGRAGPHAVAARPQTCSVDEHQRAALLFELQTATPESASELEGVSVHLQSSDPGLRGAAITAISRAVDAAHRQGFLRGIALGMLIATALSERNPYVKELCSAALTAAVARHDVQDVRQLCLAALSAPAARQDVQDVGDSGAGDR